MNKPGSLPHLDGQRTLAAIVFTDVVGYSARMGADEEGTLRLFKQDSIQIQSLCEKHEGEIRKFTGDGMLMYFHSAVQAVACALEIQRQQAEKLKTQPAKDVLLHRIGIHLGDVFVSAGDVMGDGVNIAARLQAEAEPGGICVSQTVYDVVKNKIALRATYLGPRELKNISEAVGVYKILLAAADGDVAAKPAGNPRKKLIIGLAIGGAVAAAVIVALLLRPAEEADTITASAPAAADTGPSATNPSTGTEPPAGSTTESSPAAPTSVASTPAPSASPEPTVAAPVQAPVAVATPAPAPAPVVTSTPAPAPAPSEREQLLARLRAQQSEARNRAETSSGAVAPAASATPTVVRSVDPETGELLRTPDGTPLDEVVLTDTLLAAASRGGLGFLEGRSRQDAGTAATSLRQRDFVVAGARKDHIEKLGSTDGLGLINTWFKATLAEYNRDRALRVNIRMPEGWFPVEIWADKNATLSLRTIYGIEEFVYEEISPEYLGQLLLAVAERRMADGVRLPDRTKAGFRDFGRAFALPEIEARARALP